MAGFKNSRRYENLKRLTTEQLEEQLRTAPFLADNQETSEYYDVIEEIILERETETPTGRLSDLDRSWEEFRQQYAAPEGRGLRLYSGEEAWEEKAPAKGHKNIFRKVVLLAAAISIMFACMIAAQAAGVDVFGALARWTEETFRFKDNSDTIPTETTQTQTENEAYLAIKTEVDKLDISIPVVPTWFPEDFELQEIKASSPDITSFEHIVCLFSSKNDQNFTLSITKYEEKEDISNTVFEKDSQSVIEYVGSNKLFYIMSNNNTKTAAWSDGQLVISMSGPLTEEAIKKMIDSISSEE